MRGKSWFSVLMVVLVAVVAVSGCKKKPRRGSGMDDVGNVGGVVPSMIVDDTLPGRDLMGVELGAAFEPVYFEYDSSSIAPGERGKLERIADQLRGGAQGVIVEGHCDERGSSEYNLALGERRALAVRAYLIGLGVDGSRLQTKSYGEEKPAAMGHGESAWSQNRRAEFVLFE